MSWYPSWADSWVGQADWSAAGVGLLVVVDWLAAVADLLVVKVGWSAAVADPSGRPRCLWDGKVAGSREQMCWLEPAV